MAATLVHDLLHFVTSVTHDTRQTGTTTVFCDKWLFRAFSVTLNLKKALNINLHDFPAPPPLQIEKSIMAVLTQCKLYCCKYVINTQICCPHPKNFHLALGRTFSLHWMGFIDSANINYNVNSITNFLCTILKIYCRTVVLQYLKKYSFHLEIPPTLFLSNVCSLTIQEKEHVKCLFCSAFNC